MVSKKIRSSVNYILVISGVKRMFVLVLIVSFLSILELSSSTLKSSEFSQYEVSCTLSDAPVRCLAALFSSSGFNLNGDIVATSCDFCDLECSSISSMASSDVAERNSKSVAVLRGGCSFQTKVEIAEKVGYNAVVIVNTDDSIFPPGATENFTSSIPCLMVPNSFMNLLESNLCSSSIDSGNADDDSNNVCISYHAFEAVYKIKSAPVDKKHSAPVTATTGGNAFSFTIGLARYTVWFFVIFTVLIASYFSLSTSSVSESSSNSTPREESSKVLWRILFILSCITLLILLVTLRLVSLRPARPDSNDNYSHDETDEKIFEHLIRTVSRDWLNYRLGWDVIYDYGLAVENYGDGTDLFIHPPVFVYSCAFLASFGVPLAVIPIIHQVITACSLIGIHYNLYRLNVLSDANGAVWSLLCFVFCPVVAFCGTKIWVDNAAMSATSLAVCAHISLLRFAIYDSNCEIRQLWGIRSFYAQFASGIIFFGGIAMNTKITTLAIFPFLLGWSDLQYRNAQYHTLSQNSTTGIKNEISLIGRVTFLFPLVAGFIIGAGPWICLYYSENGRLFPNAWPSAELRRTNAFVRAAVGKPFFSYITTLLSTSPLVALGFFYGVALFLYHFFSLSWILSDGPLSPSYAMCILALWPVAFIVANMILAGAGAGTQMRFILPALPGAALLASVCIQQNRTNSVFIAVCAALLSIAAIHTLFYGVVFSTLFADISDDIFSIVDAILTFPVAVPSSPSVAQEITNFLKHHGVIL